MILLVSVSCLYILIVSSVSLSLITKKNLKHQVILVELASVHYPTRPAPRQPSGNADSNPQQLHFHRTSTLTVRASGFEILIMDNLNTSILLERWIVLCSNSQNISSGSYSNNRTLMILTISKTNIQNN